MGGACRISGLALVGVSDFGGMRQYVPPKCIVRRLRSVRQVHKEVSLRKFSILCSSAGFIKFGSKDRPGTGIRLWVKAGFASSSDPDWGGNKMCSALGRLLMGLKNSLMALRFLIGCSMSQFRKTGFLIFWFG